MIVFCVISLLTRTAESLPSYAFLYIIQPVGALVVAGAAWYMAQGTKDRAHRRTEKAYIVASVLRVWFVLYFLSGLGVAYVRNTLITTPVGVLLNIFGYGVTAASLEYVRHRLMQLAGRRNIRWFGALIVIVFTLQQLNMTAFSTSYTPEQFLKFFVSDIVPVLTSNMLLTYLAVGAGLPAMLVYRLGTLSTTLLLPILPKFDWYMIGISAILLSLATYIVIDRAQQGRQQHGRRHHFHIQRASNITFIAIMIALVLFMTGALRYKPVVIVSDSMKPLYSRGAIVLVRMGYDPMDIESGDIIQYKHKQTGQVITHRVVDIQQAANGSGERVFITKGDNNQSQDIPVEQSQVLGVVRAQVPYLGYPTIWLRSFVG
jgi:signal peptidase